MNKSIRLLVEGFFDDEIFNTDNDIKTDIEDLGRYYDYKVGEIFYQNKKPYAICCGDKKYFKDNKPRFCLLEKTNNLYCWRTKHKLVKKLGCFEFEYFYLRTFNDFMHIDEDGYKNTLIIKNNYNISEFPVFEYCIKFGDNVYLPAIDELLILFLYKDKLSKYSFSGGCYWSSTLYSANSASSIYVRHSSIYYNNKDLGLSVHPFFHIN